VHRLARYLPLLHWLPRYRACWFRSDLAAGITVWAVIVPEALAYAGIAGVPPLMGLYTVPIPLFLYMLLGTSRQMVVGPDSATALLSAGVVGSLALSASPNFQALTSALALLVGLFFLLVGLFRLGWLANLVSGPVMSGFLQGIVLVTIIGQLPHLLAIPVQHGHFFQRLAGCLRALPDLALPTAAVGPASLVLLLVLKKKVRRLPAAMVTAILAIVTFTIFDPARYEVAVTGSLATSLPPLRLPDVAPAEYLQIIPGALVIALLGYVETLGAAEGASLKDDHDIDPNQELIALGACNIGAALSSGFVAVGSLSKTSVALATGARTQVANLISAILSLLTLFFLMPLLRNLPVATLAAIVIEAMIGLDQTAAIRRVFRFSIPEGLLALGVILAVLILGVIQGIGLGVVLSIVLLLERASHPGTAVLGRIPGSDTFRDIRRHPEALTVPGLLIFRFDAELVFPSSRYFVRQALLRVKESPVPVRVFLINAETINDIDVTGTMLLLRLQRKLAAKNIPLWIAQMQDPVIDKLRRLEAGRPLVGEHLYPSVKEAVADFENAQPELHVTPR
jgi:high affinity sulfate transporter 1